MRITDKELPKKDGSNERISSQLPQQPNGTNEKNEKNELSAVLVELPSNTFFFYLTYYIPSFSHNLTYKLETPIAIAKPNTIIPFTLTTAFKAAKGGRLGVVTITTNMYVIKEIDPAINPLFNAFLLTA